MFGNMTHASMGELEFKLTQVEFKASAAHCVRLIVLKFTVPKRTRGRKESRK